MSMNKWREDFMKIEKLDVIRTKDGARGNGSAYF